MMILVFVREAEVLRSCSQNGMNKGKTSLGPDYGRVNRECFEIKVLPQRDTERAHHTGLDEVGNGNYHSYC